MSGSIVAPIRRLRVFAVQLPYSLRQIPLHRLDHEMVVVCHEAEGMADPIVAFDRLGQYIEKKSRDPRRLRKSPRADRLGR